MTDTDKNTQGLCKDCKWWLPIKEIVAHGNCQLTRGRYQSPDSLAEIFFVASEGSFMSIEDDTRFDDQSIVLHTHARFGCVQFESKEQ